MSRNIVTYLLLYQVFSHVLVLRFVRLMEISLSDVNTADFSQILLKNERPFYYQTFPDPAFAIALFYFTRSRHINKCKYLIFVKLNNISQ